MEMTLLTHGSRLLDEGDRSSEGYYTVPWRAHIGISVNRFTGTSPGASLLERSDGSSHGCYTVPWRAHIGMTVNRYTGI